MRHLALLAVTTLAIAACTTTTENKRAPNQEDMKVMLKDKDGNLREAKSRPDLVDSKNFMPINPDEIDEAIDQQNALRQNRIATTPTGPSATTVASEGAQADAEYVKEAVSLAAEHIQNKHRSSYREAGPVAAETAQRWLKNGNTRFTKGFFRNDGASGKDRLRLAQNPQRPHSVVVACSDSRVPPEVAFDQKLGEIFVVRNMATTIADNSLASIEYAVDHLGSNLVVLLGHDSCGGIEAALAAMNGAPVNSPALQNTLDEMKPRLQSFAGKAPSHGHVDETWANLDGIEQELLERSAILKDAVASGEVKIVKALYRLNSGLVEWR